MIVHLLVGVTALLFLAVIRYYKFVSRYPKGPTPLPFIGNSLERSLGNAHESFAKLSEGFGGLCTVFFPHPIIHIRDYSMIRKAYIDKGVINSNGDIWREQRRTAIMILKDFGMGKNLMEQLVQSSVNAYLEYLEGIEDKKNVNLRWPIQITVANIINELLFGFRFGYNDCEPLTRYILVGFSQDSLVWLGVLFDFLNHIPWIGYHTLHKHIERARQTNQYIIDSVNKAMGNYEEDQEPKCFVHAYKKLMRTNPSLDDGNLMTTCADFFFAGIETTTTTLRWAMLILTKYPMVQEKMRAEIHSVIGKERLPSLGDQTQMIYTRAVIHEIQRFANILTSNVMRMTTRDTTVGGHFIPAHTIVNADIHYVMAHDPLFVNPEEFRPERYLTDDGKELRKELVDRTIPFSLGKRVCAGESMARAEIFLVLTATVQRYRLSPRPGEEIDLELLHGPIKIPKEQLIALERVI